jgi:kinesin family protein 11
MQGDIVPTPLGNPSAQAGMMPRVLFKLFHYLESAATDYVVKVSYVELYNENLSDLLLPDMPESARPKLNIFEDARRKGVFIQGLTEEAVTSPQGALALLTRGSQQRQTAATNMNKDSSRSHAIFTLTVHTKETSPLGEDLLRVGKMNLVDLAGSENIGRSGAKDKRAQEAGKINQSLLALGRVIDALVDKSPHVPYRDSTLTRLLQDSLGGRTKTCIIATVSPTRSNVEETLSTLDYALRARSIRTKPELNQRVMRNALLKDYVAEIDRLKADLRASKEKDGIFVSDLRWNQMETDLEMARTERDEARKDVEIGKNRERSLKEEFDFGMDRLRKTEAVVEDLRHRLVVTKDELQVTKGELQKTTGALEDEVVVTAAYQDNERALDGVAGELKKVVEENSTDLSGLYDKLGKDVFLSASCCYLPSSFQTGRLPSSPPIQSLSMLIAELCRPREKHFLYNSTPSSSHLRSTRRKSRQKQSTCRRKKLLH